MTTSIFLLALLLAAPLLGHAQVPGNILARVVQIRYGDGLGSAVVIDHGSRQFIVTANHVIAAAGSKAQVEVLIKVSGKPAWLSLDVSVVHGPNSCVDVAVLVPGPSKLISADPLPFPYELFVFGQEAYFLGYPRGLYNSANAAWIVPLIKHGYISAKTNCAAIVPGGSESDALILLDGMNNHGFSGGAVVAPDLNENGHPLKLIGIVTSFLPDQPEPGFPGGINSGIVVVVPSEQVAKLIEQYEASEHK